MSRISSFVCVGVDVWVWAKRTVCLVLFFSFLCNFIFTPYVIFDFHYDFIWKKSIQIILLKNDTSAELELFHDDFDKE